MPKGFFPVQDTGVILGISEGPQNISFTALAERQQELAQVILKDPDVESLSSFIGVDGTNTTPNSGRIQINLKPRDQRKSTATEIIRRLQPELAKVQRHHPVHAAGAGPDRGRPRQPHAVSILDGRCRRAGAVGLGSRSWWTNCASCLHCATWPPISRMAACKAELVIDRDTASRLGILPQAIDDTLYDAFGQRQVSTIFTQLNQYHVVLEVDPQFPQNPDSLKNIYVHSSSGMQVPLASFSHFQTSNTALAINHQGQFPVVTLSFNLAPGVSLGEATKPSSRRNRTFTFRPAFTPVFRERRRRSGIRFRPSPG